MKYLLSILCLFSFILANNVCDVLYSDFEHSLKLIALSNVDESKEDSANRKTNRLLEKNTEYLKISMYLTLMKENTCNIKNLNWDWSKYFNNALQYRIAELTGTWSCLPDCLIDNWSGNLELDILEDPDGIPSLTGQKGIDCTGLMSNGDGTYTAMCIDRIGRHAVVVGDSISNGIVTNITGSKVVIYKDEKELIFNIGK